MFQPVSKWPSTKSLVSANRLLLYLGKPCLYFIKKIIFGLMHHRVPEEKVNKTHFVHELIEF